MNFFNIIYWTDSDWPISPRASVDTGKVLHPSADPMLFESQYEKRKNSSQEIC